MSVKKKNKKAETKSATQSAPVKAAANPASKMVRDLASLLEETGLTEIEVEHGGMRVRVARQGIPGPSAPVYAAPQASAASAPSAAPAPEKKGTAVTSPMVGTAYLSPQPGAAAFVKVGDTVKEGQTVLIIEAMKTMNQVAATKGGKVVEIYVQDGQPLEFGEPLMLID